MEERQKRYMNETYPCWYPVQIRFRDLDPLAHVNNTVYFIYFEEARSHYVSQLESLMGQWPSDEEPHNPRIQAGSHGHYGMLVKEISCTYALPLVRSDHAEVGVRVVKVGRTSIIMDHQIRDINEHERIFATGRSIMVWSNYYSGRPHPVPLSLRYAIEQMEGRAFPLPNS